MSDALQFDQAEMPTEAKCGQCQTTLRGQYFQANGTTLCGTCCDAIKRVLAGEGSSAGRFLRALLFGIGAMLLGAIGYGLWMGFTESEFALITIAIGWFVGKCVRRGSGNRGGWRYGLLAVALTYCAISFAFFGVAMAHFRSERHLPAQVAPSEVGKPSQKTEKATAVEAPAESEKEEQLDEPATEEISLMQAMGYLLLATFALPFIAATQSVLSLVITGFGLWQAWAINRRLALEITGPHSLGSDTP